MPNPLVYVAADFTTSAGLVDPEQLRQEFAAASFPSTPVSFDHIDISDFDAVFSVSVWFSGVPDATDEASADAIVAAHTATGPTDPEPGPEPPGGGNGVTLAETWKFDSATADADPGAGKFRLNNATQPSATFIYLSKTTKTGVDFGTLLLLLDGGSFIYVQDQVDSTRFHLLRITGIAVDATTYVKVPVVAEDSGSDLLNGKDCGFLLQGSSVGVQGPVSSVDNTVVRFDGTSGELLQGSGVVIDDSDNMSGVGTVNGVTVQAHGSRHNPGGADPVTTGTPVQIGTANAQGTAASLARSDHVHQRVMQTGYLDGLYVSHFSVTQVQITAGRCRSDDDTFDIVVSSTLTAAITGSGANGLDTGTEASNTWYSIWVIGDSSGTNSPASLLSVSSSAPTLPAGYDKKRRVGWVRNDGSSNFLLFTQQTQAGRDRWIHYDGVNENTVQLLSLGGATTPTDVDMSSLVPPTCRFVNVLLRVIGGSPNDYAVIRPNGVTVAPIAIRAFGGTDSTGDVSVATTNLFIRCDSSQIIEYENNISGVDTDLWVLGWQDNL